MSIILSGVSYRYRNQQFLFEGIDLSVAAGAKAAVVGDNGAGKSTLLKLVAGELAPAAGSIACSSRPYYVPQHLSAAGISAVGVLGVADKLDALRAICGGSADPRCYDILADDWDVEARCRAALDHWGLPHVGLTDRVDALSGGERTKLCLAGISVHNPSVILLDEPNVLIMDEPGNDLDTDMLAVMEDLLDTWPGTLIVVSHDRYLLERVTDQQFALIGGKVRHLPGGVQDYLDMVEAIKNGKGLPADTPGFAGTGSSSAKSGKGKAAAVNAAASLPQSASRIAPSSEGAYQRELS